MNQHSADPTEVRAALESYLRGHATGDPEFMRNAFLPAARIEGIREGRFTSWTLEEYCALFPGTPAAGEATRRRQIDAIDRSGTSASAKATLFHGDVTFTDYFVLLEVDGVWKIASKVYHAHRA